ncbi:retrovirus-related pol polyprotein from transposon TNT 1-94, partial [Tanacetum coccineum]
VYEDEMKRSSSSTSNSQNLAFLSSENTSSTNEVSISNGNFRVNTTGGTNSSSQDLQQIDQDDLEELYIRWQVAMLTVRVQRFIQKTGRNLDFKGKQLVTFDKSKVECYNCHRKGHFAKEYKSGRNGQCKTKTYLPIKRSYYTKLAFRPKNLKQDVKTSGVKYMTIAETRAVVNTGKGKMDNDLKKSRWVWRPKGNYMDHESKEKGSFILKKFEYVDPKGISMSVDHAVVDSGCSSHLTGNKAYLSDYEDYNGGFVAFGMLNSGRTKVNTGMSFLILVDQKVNSGRPILTLVDDRWYWEFSVARTPQQNGVAERKNKTLIEAARTMLADSLLPIPFWAEAVNTACYVLNRVLVTKPQNKTPYELLIGKPPSISFMRPFGCPLTILNTLDPLGKFDGKSDEGYLLRYSTTSKVFRVYNKRTKRVEENLHIDFLEYQPNVAGNGPDLMFDLDFLTFSMNHIPVSVENQITVDAGTKESYVAGSSGKDKEPTQEYILLPLHPHRPRIPGELDSEDIAAEQALKDDLERMVAQEMVAQAVDDATRQAFEKEKRKSASTKRAAQATSINKLNTGRPSVNTANTPYVSAASTPTGANAGESSFVYLGGQIPIDASTLPNADLPTDLNMPDLEDVSNAFPNDGIFSGAYDDDDVGVEADFNNMDNTIDVSPIPTLRVHKDHPKGQILGDPKSAVQTIQLIELMDLHTKLSDKVLDLENVKNAQALEIQKLKKRVRKLESKKKSRTPQLKRRLFKVRIESSAEKSLGDQENASKHRRNEIDQDEGIAWFQEDLKTQGRYGHDIGVNTASTSIITASINMTTAEPITTASAPITTIGVSVSTTEPSTPPTTTTTPIEDEDLTIAQTLMKMKSEKSKAKGVTMQEPSESGTRRLQAELDEEARLEREREEEVSKAANIAEWDDV